MSEQDGYDDSRKGLSITGFVLGIVSLLVPFFGFIAGIVGIVLSAIAIKHKQGIKGLAVTGLVLSIISVGLTILYLLAFGTAFFAFLGIASAFA